MMKTYKNIKLFITAFFLFSTGTMQAQKYGHLNFGSLVALMPETKSADEELEGYQKGLVAIGEKMASDFQAKYAEFVKQVQNGGLTPVQQQQKQTELEKQQQEILDYEQKITQKLGEKREELLKPLVEKAEQAIIKIAKENGYVMVFDTSVFNAVLFAQDAVDLMPLVKAELEL